MQVMTTNEHLKKRLLNQLVPISRLHPEIFSIVFCQVSNTATFPPGILASTNSTKDRIGITHVCHAWRDIAINTPLLWATMFITVEDHLEWVQEMLRRSKQCPLSVVVSKSTRSVASADPVLHELKNYMHRFRKLVLQLTPVDDLHNFFSNSHAHRLEQLHIWMDPSSDNSSDTPPDNSDTPTAAIFTLCDKMLRADSLRHLGIKQCGLDFHTTFLRSLTHLEIRDLDQDCRLSCVEFVAILAGMPGLKRLKLGEFLKDVENAEEYVAMSRTTHLHIKSLDLTCLVLGEMVQFLCTLILPPSCQLRLQISHEGPETAPGFHLITSWLSKHFESAPKFHSFQSYFRSWGIDDTGYVGSDLSFCNLEELPEESDIDPDGHIDRAARFSASVLLCYDSESEGELIKNHWRSFLRSLPMGKIASFMVLEDSVTLPDFLWVEFFAPLTTLKRIMLNSTHYPAFFRIASPDSNYLPFPVLSSVTVRVRGVEDYLSIAKSLDSRREAGLAPVNLVLHTDDIEPHAIARLRESAVSVEIRPSGFRPRSTSPTTI